MNGWSANSIRKNVIKRRRWGTCLEIAGAASSKAGSISDDGVSEIGPPTGSAPLKLEGPGLRGEVGEDRRGRRMYACVDVVLAVESEVVALLVDGLPEVELAFDHGIDSRLCFCSHVRAEFEIEVILCRDIRDR